MQGTISVIAVCFEIAEDIPVTEAHSIAILQSAEQSPKDAGGLPQEDAIEAANALR